MNEDHQIAAVFPLLSEPEMKQLADDIKENGLLNPITLFDGKILDGRNRARACAIAGIEPRFETLPANTDPIKFVISKNLRHRHLTFSQRVKLADELAKLKWGSNQFQKVEMQICKSSRNGHIATITETAKLMGVSERAVGQRRFVKNKGAPEVVQAMEGETISVDRAHVIAHLPKKEQPAALESKINRQKPQAPAVTEPDPKELEKKAFEAEKLAIINAPSIFPVDAELPTHPDQEIHTRHIREGIEELRKHEPDIAKMSRGQLFKLIHPCTQRIQTYGRYGAEQHVKGPIDPRFLEWAGECFSKLRAREAILLRRESSSETSQRSKKSAPEKVTRVCRVGDEFSRLLKSFSGSFKKLLKEFPSQYEEQLTAEILLLVTNTFAEKREAHAKRLSLHKQNGATAP